MSPDTSILLLRITFTANILVAGTVGAIAFSAPATASRTIYDGAFEPSGSTRVLGALWLAIAALSALGLFAPSEMAPVLLLQLIYKALWLLLIAAQALARTSPQRLPVGMAIFFVVWVIWLPFAIPWNSLL